jgi:autotransporter-associated beta strand protein
VATFNVEPYGPTFTTAPELDVPATISGTPSMFLTVLYKDGLGQMRLGGNNTFADQVRINAGTLIPANGGALGSTSDGTRVYNNATLALDGGITINNEFLLLDSTNPAALDSRTGVNSWNGGIYLNRDSRINVNATLITSGAVDGLGGLIKVGPGFLSTGGSANNTYAGDTFINGGTFALLKPAGVTAIPHHVTVGTGAGGSSASLSQQSSFTIIGSVTVNSGGSWNLNGQSESFSIPDLQGHPPLTLNGGGSVQTGAGILYLPAGGDVVVNPGSNTTSTISGNIGLDPGTHHVTVGNGSTTPGNVDLSVSAVIGQTSTAAGIQKDGAGTLLLSGANTYTGTNIVTAGTLLVNGPQPQSAVQVNSGTLGGSGTVGRINMTGSSAVLAPGASPGILTCSNLNASALGNGTLQIELNGTIPGSGYDQVNVRGTVTLSNINLNASLNFPAASSNEFVIISNDGADAVLGAFNGLPQGAQLSLGGGVFNISYTGGDGNDVVLTHLFALPPPILYIEDLGQGNVRVFWSTNYPAYNLQYNKNLSTTNWAAASPVPVMLGTNYTVTNPIVGPQKFYRLSTLPPTFTPPAPVLSIETVPPASVRLLWPADDPAFRLQFNTNLTTTNWISASPAPVILGEDYTVTNPLSGAQTFYRLIKP